MGLCIQSARVVYVYGRVLTVYCSSLLKETPLSIVGQTFGNTFDIILPNVFFI